MNIGDTVIDIRGKHWIIYDFVSYQMRDYLCVTDVATQKDNNIMEHDKVDILIPKPENVEYLFFNRRNKNLEGLTSYLW